MHVLLDAAAAAAALRVSRLAMACCPAAHWAVTKSVVGKQRRRTVHQHANLIACTVPQCGSATPVFY